jgi:carbamoyltransferase
MYILGISAFYHDSAACLLHNGTVISAAQEERFTRKKHDQSFPNQAIAFCLEAANINIDKLGLIVFYEKPFIKFDRIINSLQNHTPFGFNLFRKTIKSWIKKKLWIPSIIKKELGFKGQIIFSEHHESHAAGAFFTSPFKESVIVTIDGVGEKACTTISVGKNNKISLLKEQHYPHSIGLLYSAFTQYCGFRVNSGEYKLMGLAPFGKPIYKTLILENFVSYSSDGLIKLNLKNFEFDKGNTTINKNFCTVFGQDARKPEGKMTSFYYDVASSIQSVIEDIVLTITKHAKALTGLDNLCLSGGVALNCKANGELLSQQIFKNIWVQPASGDSGCAQGAAYIGWYHYLSNPRIFIDNSLKQQIYLGKSYDSESIKTTLDKYQLDYKSLNDSDLCNVVAESFTQKKIIGWFQGKMEFGPRALGNRSILASPLFTDMKKHVNLNIKKREGFRPFAPIILEEDATDWFTNCTSSKYMLFTFKSERKKEIPSCIHEDDTARVQTLSKTDQPLLHQLISVFKEKTGCPVLINTSFNVRGEPIVASPTDALKCFFQTDMDVLVLGNFVILKDNNKNVSEVLMKVSHYELD